MNRRRTHFLTWFRLGLLGIGAAAAGSLYTPYPAQLVRALKEQPAPQTVVKEVVKRVTVEKPAPPAPEPEVKVVQAWHPENAFAMPAIELPPFPPALPEKVEPGRFEHINSIAPGFNMHSSVLFAPGTTAFADRKRKDAYMLKLSMQLFLPHAADGKELLQANPKLPQVLADYEGLMGTAKVSPWYRSLYLHKQNRLRKTAATLDRLLDRHNFYDTDTILQLAAPKTGRKVLWVQADMDVVSDGSDGDRLPNMPEKVLKSDYYQPTTSYRWKKTGQTPNPLLKVWEERLEKLTKDKSASKEAIADARATVYDLKTCSFLLAEYDPFIVIPLTFKEGKDDSYRPQPGDYAAVIVEDRVFPAIVGDFGPNYKTGEASLRLAKMVNPKATSLARPVSDLKVSYLIFPHTKLEENSAPDYARLNTRCRELLDDIGGLGPEAKLQTIDDLLAPKPETAPAK
ncbi:MAG: glycoside hydrolase family 75 protein [Akkermansia sp.]|nr:glycoside hydrolase family 75 protein [Akkermansia sp.]